MRPHPARARRATLAAALAGGLNVAVLLWPTATAARPATPTNTTATPTATAAPSPVATPTPSTAAPAQPEAAAAPPPEPAVPAPAQATSADRLVLDAREAFRTRNLRRLAELRATAVQQRHPLLGWVEYWDTTLRLAELTQADLEAFYSRHSGTYVEDRLRNDWLLELGRRRDWANFARDLPRFRMADDREVACYGHLPEPRDGALAAWMAQRESDDGCALLGRALLDTGRIGGPEVWARLRVLVDANRARAARQTAALMGVPVAQAVGEIFDAPARWLARQSSTASLSEPTTELIALALARMAVSDPPATARLLAERWQAALPPETAAWAWAAIGRQAALDLEDDAPAHYARGWALLPRARAASRSPFSDEQLAWNVRSALRAARGDDRWSHTLRAIGAMSPAEQQDPAWQYWRARAEAELAPDGAAGDAQRAASRQAMETLATGLNFYGKLALEDLGRGVVLPPKPKAPTAEERAAARDNPGLSRALTLIALGLRSEGNREWNFTLRGMDDRALLAAAQMACDREVWDRCINTSDRTRAEVDLNQRFPMPFRGDVTAVTREIGLDASYVYGLIRQESRFIMDARSGVGASGLMQLMPETARLTARRIGLPYTPDMINDRQVNLRLGTSYFKSVLDDFNGSLAMAAAAYNAGPGRPRRWRNGPVLEPAIWAENIPFTETRDYVKKVLSNAVVYGALLTGRAPSLRTQLGPPIGPRGATEPPPDRTLP
jgi:soluble lytic murein transglycosylase